MGSKRVLLFVPKTIEDNRLPWLRQGSFLKKYNMVQRVALATTGFLSLEEYNMLQKITMATTGFLSFTTPYLESSKGCGFFQRGRVSACYLARPWLVHLSGNVSNWRKTEDCGVVSFRGAQAARRRLNEQ